MRYLSLSLLLLSLTPAAHGPVRDLPANFENIQILSGLGDPDGMAFAPDGRLFISERITGKLRIAKYTAGTDTWALNAQPFYTFDIPKDGTGQPERRRSAGLRDVTFDPNFATNGFVYAFYMKDDVHHNRVVRIKASTADPDLADLSFGTGGEELLLDLPFNTTESSGSHNGGAVEFGPDGLLYITTGDGWEGPFAGDPVQSLTTFTGKVLRINPDGTIPTSNPFYGSTTGTYRSIYALGLRNPYSMSAHADTGVLYINEARGTNKAQIYVVEAGANYKHEGTGLGTPRDPWANAADAGGELITGGAWYPATGGPFPAVYHGAYFAALWGGNSETKGRINYVKSNTDPTVFTFETDVGEADAAGTAIKPVITRIGPDGNLYYLLTSYETSGGTVQMVRYTALETVATPVISPNGGTFPVDVTVSLSTATPGADVHYTTDFSEPTPASPLYTTAFTLTTQTVVKAKAFNTGFNPSSTASAVFIIGDTSGNLPPVVDAGPDQSVFVGQLVTLDGSGTTDPDGDDEFLTGEQWTLLSGPPVTIQDATEEIAFFTPDVAGVYQFELEVSDGIDTGTDEVTITAGPARRVTDGLVAHYTFAAGSGTTVYDVSGTGAPLDVQIQPGGTAAWVAGGGLALNGSTLISGTSTKAINACKAADELSLEAWVTPANTTQGGPARILSISLDPFNRNLTLAQDGNRYDVRLRTTATNDNGQPSTASLTNTVTTTRTHVAYTWDGAGTAKVYLNGTEQVTNTVSGTLGNWNDTYLLALGNELTGDRPWLGELHTLALYCRALPAGEVNQNFNAGN